MGKNVQELLKDPKDPNRKEQTRERDILDRVRTEGRQREKLMLGETAALAVIESGNRAFLDFALDEVDRYGSTDPRTTMAFEWKTAGNNADVPSLRQSKLHATVPGPGEEYETFGGTMDYRDDVQDLGLLPSQKRMQEDHTHFDFMRDCTSSSRPAGMTNRLKLAGKSLTSVSGAHTSSWVQLEKFRPEAKPSQHSSKFSVL